MVDDLIGDPEENNAKSEGAQAEQSSSLQDGQASQAGSNSNNSEQYKTGGTGYLKITSEWIWFTAWQRYLKPVILNSGFWTAAATIAIAITTIIYTIYARKQWQTMERQLAATEQASYDACVGIKISQQELFESQKTNTLSQTMAIASTMQTTAQIDSEKSFITFNPRLPKPEELFQNDPNFYVVYSLKNDGKSAANNLRIGAKAILVTNDETLKASDRNPYVELQSGYLAAGGSFPGTPEIGRPITPLIGVVDSNGNGVAKDSEAVGKIFTDSAIIAVIGHIIYSDFAGTHEDRFCVPLWQMQAGTARKGGSGKNEKICANYNQKQDRYAFPAKPPLMTSQAPLPTITCKQPG